jgi:hypothetical protein
MEPGAQLPEKEAQAFAQSAPLCDPDPDGRT